MPAWLVATCAAAILVLAPARAHGFPVGGAGPLAQIAQVVETLCPDTRWEICHGSCDRVHRAVLSWPVSIYFHHAKLGQGQYALINRPFLEPQLRVDTGGFRFVFGHRIGLWQYKSDGASTLSTYLRNLGLFAEFGGSFGDASGSGGFVGGGLGLGGFGQSWLLDTLSVVYRHTWTTVESRHDLTLDLVVVLRGGWQSGGESSSSPRL